MVLPIVVYGDPVLRKVGVDIEKNHEGLEQLIADMFETMYAANGVGLAAPQVGKAIRLFVVDGTPFGEVDDDDENELSDKELKILKTFKKVFITKFNFNWNFSLAFRINCNIIFSFFKDF